MSERGRKTQAATARFAGEFCSFPEKSMKKEEREVQPHWYGVPLPRARDISVLRGPKLPLGTRFETAEDARRYSLAARDFLWQSTSRDAKPLGEYLDDCFCGYYVCGRAFCPLCARQFRRWFVGSLLKLTEKASRAKVLTIYSETYAVGYLCDADPLLAQNRLRQRLRRCGFSGSMVAGGTEVSYSARTNSWTLHFHLVVVGAERNAFLSLSEKSRGDIRWAVKCVDLTDRLSQLSYLQKFSTFHRPGRVRPGKRARAYPLPKARRLEMITWLSKYDFEDFIFLFGVRIRGDQIVGLPAKKAT